MPNRSGAVGEVGLAAFEPIGPECASIDVLGCMSLRGIGPFR
jgi:hypothetical protein